MAYDTDIVTYDGRITVLSSIIHFHKSSSSASIARGDKWNLLAPYKEDIILGSAWTSTKGLNAHHTWISSVLWTPAL